MTELTNALKGAHLEFQLSQRAASAGKPADKIEMLAGDNITLPFIQDQDDWKGAHGRISNAGASFDLRGRFLDYIPGYVTVCGAGQETVLSGPFSGCWYIRFFHEGQFHVAHVGTTGTTAVNLAVKRAFAEYTKSIEDMSQATFFKPNRAWSDAQLKKWQVGFGGETREIYILSSLEADGDCHAICLGRTKVSERGLKMKVSPAGGFKLPQRFGKSKPSFQDKFTDRDVNKKATKLVSIVYQYEVLDVARLDAQRWNDVRNPEFV